MYAVIPMLIALALILAASAPSDPGGRIAAAILLQILTVALAIMLVNTASFVGTGASSVSGAVANAATGAEAAFSIIAIYFVGFFLFLRLPMISAALSSGAGLYGVAFGGGQGRAIGASVSGATAPVRAVGRVIGNFGQETTTASKVQT